MSPIDYDYDPAVALMASEEKVQRLSGEVEALTTALADLRSWLSGVQPVDDPDIPGRSYCAICGTSTQRGHRDGCPMVDPVDG